MRIISKEVVADLYDLLKESETGLFKQNNIIIAYVHIGFDELESFTNILGDNWFDEGGLM